MLSRQVSSDGASRAAWRAVATAVVMTMPVPGLAQSPGAETLVARGAAYASQFVARFSGVVAEERYRQEDTVERRRRDLVSDFLIVQVPGTRDWTSFRDVLEVDGEPVRDRDERLVRLFLEADADSAVRQASEIARESARLNLPGIGTLNNPLLVLAFLQDRYNSRFRWSVVGEAPDAGPDVWRVRFEEFVRPTLLRGSNNRDAPATGEAWIDADTGRVLRTELRLVVGASPAGTSGMAMRSTVEIDTRFEVDADLGIALPVEMTETYLLGGSNIRTEATYGRFRQFGVSTEETLALPDAP